MPSTGRHAYEVGKPYNPRVSSWPETIEYNFRGGEHELVLFFTSPTPKEVRSVRKAPIDLALVVEQPLVMLLVSIQGAVPWSDAGYTWHRVPQADRVLPKEPSGDERPLLHVILVQADGGQIRAQRLIALSPEFGRELHRAIRQQAESPWDESRYTRVLHGIQSAYPRTESLLDLAAVRFRSGA